MNIRDMENEDGETRGLIEIKVSDHAIAEYRRIWRFSIDTGQGGPVVYLERPDIRELYEDEAILCAVAARLWVVGKNAGARLADGRPFADIKLDELWRIPADS